MMKFFLYIQRESPIHRLTGAAKFATLVLWSIAVMSSFCTPFLAFLTLLGFFVFRLSRIKVREVGPMLVLTLVLMVLNNLLIYLFAPEQGVEIYGSRHLLLPLVGPYTITAEQLLYQANVILKYTGTIPIILLFVATTNPSEFAASLNRLGIPYRIAYAVSLAMRYIPDTRSDFEAIYLTQQARGVEMKKQGMLKRIRAAATILLPLVLSSMERIDVIANAMELRGFGKKRRRTWYMGRDFGWGDFFCILWGILLVAFSFGFTFMNGSRFWNPFG